MTEAAMFRTYYFDESDSLDNAEFTDPNQEPFRS